MEEQKRRGRPPRAEAPEGPVEYKWLNVGKAICDTSKGQIRRNKQVSLTEGEVNTYFPNNFVKVQ